MIPTVLIFLKAPVAGAVKTRLAVELGDAEALRIYRWMAERQLAAVPAGWPVEVHFTPADTGEAMRNWLGEAADRAYFAQPDVDLGARLQLAAEAAFGRGAPAVFLIGGDCPRLDAAALTEAAGRLAKSDAVMGPAVDGGYYLLGLRAPRAAWFEGIAWSTPAVAQQTRDRAKAMGLRLAELPVRRDVDTRADWLVEMNAPR